MTTRKITLSAAALLMAAALAGCSGNTTSASSNSSSAAEAGSSAADTSAADSSAADSTASDSTASKLDTDITVVSREDGSGTRGAFVELMGIEQKNEAGEKEDMTRGDAEISNSTNGVMMSVAGNVDAIGYISLGSLNDTVKALDVNGVECSVADIKSGDYVVARPYAISRQSSTVTPQLRISSPSSSPTTVRRSSLTTATSPSTPPAHMLPPELPARSP